NVISGNHQDGLFVLSNSFGNFVVGNYIGIDATGTSPVPNRYNGISVNGAVSNSIGDSNATSRNVISGNGFYGIEIASNAPGNSVFGNYIGTDWTAGAALPNQLS